MSPDVVAGLIAALPNLTLLGIKMYIDSREFKRINARLTRMEHNEDACTSVWRPAIESRVGKLEGRLNGRS